MRRTQAAVLIVTALLTGCGGGVPGRAKSAPPPSTGPKTVSVAFHIVPTTVPSGARRRPKYVSIGTQSASIAVSAPGAPATTFVIGCDYGVCNGSVDAPVDTDTFAVKLYQAPGATGNVLSSGSTTQTIVAGQANAVNLTFDGIPAKTALTFDMPNPLIGTPLTFNLDVTALDAGGWTIVGAGNYDPPLVLTLTDPSGATSLSKTTVTSPSDVVTFSYNGAAKVVSTVTSAVQGLPADQTAVFEPANISAEFADPTPEGFPADIIQGPDGAMWFTDGLYVNRITTAGAITKYAATGAPSSIIVGPDGALWFTEFGNDKQYGRLDPADGSVTEHAVAVSAGTFTVAFMAFGADGNVYLTDDGTNQAVYAVVPATGALVKSYSFGSAPTGIVAGPDGAIWVGLAAGSIARIGIPDGLTSTYPTSGKVVQLTAGTDGNVWFTDDTGKIGNVTPAGAVTEFPIPQYAVAPYGHAYGIITAPDGSFWFTYGHMTSFPGYTCRLGHAGAAGVVASYAIAECVTPSLAFGPDHNIWLAESRRAKIGIFSSFDMPAR